MEYSDIAKNIRDGYDAIAEQYMELVTESRVSDPRSEWIKDFLGRLSDGSHVLDLGCGPGVPTAAAFVRDGHRVTGIDISPRQVELARVNVPPGRFLIGDALTTNFPSGSFGAIAALFVLIPAHRAVTPKFRAPARLEPAPPAPEGGPSCPLCLSGAPPCFCAGPWVQAVRSGLLSSPQLIANIDRQHGRRPGF
jgi:SAM-dependent methyltransferase